MMDTEKLKADEPLTPKHNRARLHHVYELDSDAENLSDHDNGHVFRRALDSERTMANGYSRNTRKGGSAGKASKSNGGSASNALLPPSSDSDGGRPGRSRSSRRKGGRRDEAEADGAEQGKYTPEDRLANNARHRGLRMKTPKLTCAFLPGCNNPVNRSRRPEGQACLCYSPISTRTPRYQWTAALS